MSEGYQRRWRGFSKKQVSARMKAITKNRFKSEEEKRLHMQAMQAARGSWEMVDGKRVFIRRKKMIV